MDQTGDMRGAARPTAAPQTVCDPAALVAMVRAGDLAALDRITRCHGDRLMAVGRRYCRSRAEAEDAVQDALLAAGTHLDSFRGEGSVEGWLVRMVANACHHMRRGRKNAPQLHQSRFGAGGGSVRDGATAIDAVFDAGAVLESPDPSPEQRAMVGELALAVGAALQELEPTNRAVVLLAEAEGWSGPEIAQELGLTPGAVRVRLHRARGRLRERLAPLMADAGEVGGPAAAVSPDASAGAA